MKLPAFDHSRMEWDSWNAFHIVHQYNAFIQFDTGEFIVCRSSWRPENRQIYKELNIQIVGTDDDLCPQLFVPGQAKPVAKSHLNHHGMQTLLLDFNHKRAVSLWPGLGKDNAPLVPERFTSAARNVTAWYAGPNAVPVGSPVTRYYPQPLTTTQRKHINDLEDASKVWLGMQPDPSVLKQKHRDVKVHVNDCIDVSFGMLTVAHRTAIAERGFNMIVKDEHPWLTFNVEGVTEDDSETN